MEEKTKRNSNRLTNICVLAYNSRNSKEKKISNQLVTGMFMLNVFSRQVFEMLLKVTSNVFAITNIPSKIRIISINLKSICFFISLLASHTFAV